MTLFVRDVQPDDAESLVRIMNPIIEAGLFTVFDTPFTVEFERDYILNFPKRGVFYAAIRQSDGQLVGFQSMEPFADYTHAFDHVGVLGTYIDLACRRQGVAKTLFTATFEAALRKGYEKIFTYIRADNSAALLTYLHHGFRIVGTAHRQAKFGQTYVDEVIVEKFLK